MSKSSRNEDQRETTHINQLNLYRNLTKTFFFNAFIPLLCALLKKISFSSKDTPTEKDAANRSKTTTTTKKKEGGGKKERKKKQKNKKQKKNTYNM